VLEGGENKSTVPFFFIFSLRPLGDASVLLSFSLTAAGLTSATFAFPPFRRIRKLTQSLFLFFSFFSSDEFEICGGVLHCRRDLLLPFPSSSTESIFPMVWRLAYLPSPFRAIFFQLQAHLFFSLPLGKHRAEMAKASWSAWGCAPFPPSPFSSRHFQLGRFISPLSPPFPAVIDDCSPEEVLCPPLFAIYSVFFRHSLLVLPSPPGITVHDFFFFLGSSFFSFFSSPYDQEPGDDIVDRSPRLPDRAGASFLFSPGNAVIDMPLLSFPFYVSHCRLCLLGMALFFQRNASVRDRTCPLLFFFYNLLKRKCRKIPPLPPLRAGCTKGRAELTFLLFPPQGNPPYDSSFLSPPPLCAGEEEEQPRYSFPFPSRRHLGRFVPLPFLPFSPQGERPEGVCQVCLFEGVLVLGSLFSPCSGREEMGPGRLSYLSFSSHPRQPPRRH